MLGDSISLVVWLWVDCLMLVAHVCVSSIGKRVVCPCGRQGCFDGFLFVVVSVAGWGLVLQVGVSCLCHQAVASQLGDPDGLVEVCCC